MPKLYPYQKQGVRQIERFGLRALLADEMGLGKSIQALMVAYRNQTWPTIIVCPAFLKWNWEREALVHFNLRAEILEGTRAPRRRRLVTSHKLTIINYDILGPWLPYLLSLEPQLVVVDEIHAIGNPKTKRARNVQTLCAEVPHILGLSGTPFKNRPIELWPILNLLRPDLYPSRWSYAQRYCRPKRTPWGWDLNGAANLDELNEQLLEHVMIRRRVKQVLHQLPAKTRHVVLLDLENREEYQEAVSNFLVWLRKTQGNAKSKRARKARRLVQMGYLRRLAAELKMAQVFQWIDTFLENHEGKLIVFAIHKKIIDLLRQRYQHLCVVVDGKVVGKKRQLAVDKFQKHPKTRLFIGNIDAAGVGANLTAASTVAIIEFPWTPGQASQAEARIHRIGQKQLCMVYYLVGRGTIEETLCRILQSKQETSSKALDGGVTEDDLNVFDQLEKELLKQQPSPLLKRQRTERKPARRR